MDVVDDPKKRARVLHQESLIPTLEKMAMHRTIAIEARGKRTLEPLHPLHKIRSDRFQRQVIVIAHDGVRVNSPIVPHARFRQCRFERLRRTYSLEHVMAVIAAVEDMIQRTGVLNSQFARHVINVR
jgi:hypothetical protein